ncbi:ATP-dependent RNA helicase dhx8 [Hondaea fermentalgiana]|uniref:RNA helicase n=1 Tax=Hondaea fermentalgiana TaxID=2315210 RepID=A0A2R5G6S2_9STRA|nr:ATP-dependent RNA helicase dhx8 [Hondaea fermentalgiana]|eukprot:GBG26225.1 ATP-dependent RNA helicase dhx8 [Hondaea fermentalgiana]
MAAVDAAAEAFARVAGGSSCDWRGVAAQLADAGRSCKSAEAFREEATKFARGFAQEPRERLEALWRTLASADADDDATTQPGSQFVGREAGAEEDDFDRSYYDAADGPEFLGDEAKWTARQARMEREQQPRRSLASRLHAEDRARQQSAWEEELMFRSGVKRGRHVDVDAHTETDVRTVVLVRNLRPAFLREGDLVRRLDAAGHAETAAVVVDENSDMAMAASRGSPAVKRIREQLARTRMKHKFWELGGSKMGAAIGQGGQVANYGQDQEEAADFDLDKVAPSKPAQEASQEGAQGPGTSGAVALPQDKQAQSLQTSDQALDAREKIQQVRENLPVRQVRDELLRVIRSNQVIVVVGETGSGKTTQLTQYLREDGYTRSSTGARLLVACTQPRRVAAMSVAKRVAEEAGCPLGGTVGYAIRFEDCTSPETEIKYMTDGVLMRETLSSPDLDKYSCVVMDEAHERSLFTDVLFGVLKGVVQRRLDFKLIVTSATMDADKFSRFFGGCATFHIPGRTFEVETYFAKSVVPDFVEAAVKQALEIHLSSPPGDILIFMTGQEDITATCQLLADRIESLGEGVPELLLLPMYSQLPADLQAKIFERAKAGQRKCIVSTNIAETSLTVDGIRYVIDSGMCKLKVFNPRVGMDALRVTPVSQANANQRAGRAGRTARGFCWRMYTENQFVHELLPAQVPEIQRTNLGNVVLLLKTIGVRDLLSFDFMDPPPKENIVDSMYQLWVLGALDGAGELTALGTQMAKYPLDPPLAKMLISARELGCAEDMLTVVSMLSVPEVFYRPAERAEESDQARERFFVPESDHLTLCNVYNLSKRQGFNAGWCAKHFIHRKAVLKAHEVREQLQSMVPAPPHGVKAVSGTPAWDLVRKAICSAYFVQAARLKSITEYVNLLNGASAALHPSSAICGIGETPDYVVYHELVLTSKEYMRTVTAIDPHWLAELGPMFFSIKGHEHLGRHDIGGKMVAGADSEDGTGHGSSSSRPAAAGAHALSGASVRASSASSGSGAADVQFGRSKPMAKRRNKKKRFGL